MNQSSPIHMLFGKGEANENIRNKMITPVSEIETFKGYMQTPKPSKFDPFVQPTIFLGEKIRKSHNHTTALSPISLSSKLRETQQERRLQNYEKYLKMWDKHEENTQKHFIKRQLHEFGSVDLALKKELNNKRQIAT